MTFFKVPILKVDLLMPIVLPIDSSGLEWVNTLSSTKLISNLIKAAPYFNESIEILVRQSMKRAEIDKLCKSLTPFESKTPQVILFF